MTPRLIIPLVLFICLASACAISSADTPTSPILSTLSPQQASTPWTLPTQAAPAQDPLFQSSGGGEPRSGGYWMMWSTCGENSQAAVAKANGGREAGWIILDDLLADPGVLIGTLDVDTCQQGVDLLQARDPSGADHGNDPAYNLAVQLLAAQLNLAAGAETCPGAEQAVQAAQLLLLSLDFNGTGGYLGPPRSNQDVETAQMLVEQLASYNTGNLCVP